LSVSAQNYHTVLTGVLGTKGKGKGKGKGSPYSGPKLIPV